MISMIILRLRPFLNIPKGLIPMVRMLTMNSLRASTAAFVASGAPLSA